MYESFFNFSRKPFAMNPDPAFLYASDQHAAALTLLEYGIESQAQFSLLTGDIGSGKTTVLRHFIRRLKDTTAVGLISNTHARFAGIYPWAAAAFGLSFQGRSDIEQYEALIGFFVDQYANGRGCLLVVDEAHNLTYSVLEELRLLSNVNCEGDLVLQTLLVGQPELRAKLNRPEMEQFAQRVSVDFHLGPLGLEDARAYIRHRLSLVGDCADVFTDEAIEFVFARTAGVPRLINQLCDLALVYAFAEQRRTVSLELVQYVIQDRKQRGAMALFGGRSPLRQLAANEGLASPDH